MRKDWTPEEEAYLEKSYDKRGVPFIAKKLKRTKNSVKRKAQSMGMNAYIGEKLYVKALARCFDCDSSVINRWISKYNLPHSIVIRGQATCKLIEQDKFWKWAEQHQDLIPWSKYDIGTILPEPEWVRKKIREYSYKNNRKSISDYDILSVVSLRRKGYTFPQISKELGRTLDSVKHIWRSYNKK
jgi:transposase